MATRKPHYCVIVLVTDQEIVLTLTDGTGAKIDEDKFALSRNAPPIDPKAVSRDVYQLLYQCANTAANGDDD